MLHCQDLHQADEDVDEVELERDGLVDHITLHEAALGHAGVVEDLLDVVKGEAAEDGEAGK